MGFVYNNPTEAMAKTYLEMNGFLVQNNLFTDLLSQPDGKSYRFEADLIGFKPPNTTIFREYDLQAPVDKRSDKPTAPAEEFFAGDNADANWVYCELKANFLDLDYSTQVKDLAVANKAAVEHKREQIANRFGLKAHQVRVVIMAYHCTGDVRDVIVANGWLYKDLVDVFEFILGRFHIMWNSKARIAYSDPWLDMAKHVAFAGYHRDPPA